MNLRSTRGEAIRGPDFDLLLRPHRPLTFLGITAGRAPNPDGEVNSALPTGQDTADFLTLMKTDANVKALPEKTHHSTVWNNARYRACSRDGAFFRLFAVAAPLRTGAIAFIVNQRLWSFFLILIASSYFAGWYALSPPARQRHHVLSFGRLVGASVTTVISKRNPEQ